MIKYNIRQNAILLLEDGTVFNGKSIGSKGTSYGEICFNTAMTGYQEIFTDPSYFGQILVMTTPHIGNYGAEEKEIESNKIMIAGLVCNQFTENNYSRPSAQKSLNQYFIENKLVGISDIDTRKLVRHLRSKGSMNAIISSEVTDPAVLMNQFAKIPSMEGLELSSLVSTKSAYELGNKSASYKVAVLDLGAKMNILRCLEERNCSLKVFPLDASLKDVLDFKPDGIMISNGPGDPSVMKGTIDLTKQLVETGIPIFGICLGHQIIALSQNLRTIKMHHGHRGVNHPIKNVITGKGEITSQNHGFVVDKESLAQNSDIEVTHTHLNDSSIAGIRLKSKNVFSVQYHPESSSGPNDSRYLFDEFINLIKKHKHE